MYSALFLHPFPKSVIFIPFSSIIFVAALTSRSEGLGLRKSIHTKAIKRKHKYDFIRKYGGLEQMKLQGLFGQSDIVVKMKHERIRWAGHGQRISETHTEEEIDDTEGNLRKMGIRCWRRKTKDRDEWRRVIKETEDLHVL
ncbi:hypothetical protein C0J52_10022 [Blattella germanica]|nr:hypothetical protein C0J52_10022 [Blattella germanica]